MNTALWILQIVLAIAFAMAGLTKLLRSKEQLATSMGWVEDFSPTAIRWIGVAELLAAMGLILPGLTGIAPVLTPLAASGLVLLMLGAARTHLKRHEPSMILINAMLGALAALVAIGRFGSWPF
ncbi:MAG: DoxX family protein [Candidatus Nanopelagicales bacterium]